MKKVVSVLIVFFFCSAYTFCADTNHIQNILIIKSTYKHVFKAQSVENGIYSILPEASNDYHVISENLDETSFSKSDRDIEFTRLLLKKYNGLSFDLIITIGDEALEYVTEQKSNFFDNLPIVICGVVSLDKQLFLRENYFSRFSKTADLSGTFDLMHRLFPNRNKVVIIADDSVLSNKLLTLFYEQSKVYKDIFTFEVWKSLKLKRLKEKLSMLENDVLLLCFSSKARTESSNIHAATLKKINYSSYSIPLFTLWESDLYHDVGYVGGSIVPGVKQGQVAAELALSILKKQNVTLPTLKPQDAAISLLDYRQLKRFAVNEEFVRPSALVLYKDQSNQDLSHNVLILLGMMFALLTVLIFLLGVNVFNRYKAEKSLGEAQSSHLTLMNNLPGMAYRCSYEDGYTFEFVSSGAKKITGYNSIELIGKSMISLTAHDKNIEPEKIEKEIQRCIANNNSYELEYKIVKKTGAVVWVWNQGVAISKNGTIEGLLIDVTDRIIAIKALKESEGWFKQLLNNSMDGIIIHDYATAAILDVNNTIASMTGYTKKLIKGMYLENFVSGNPPYTEESMLYRIKKAKEGKSQLYEFEIKRKDDSIFWSEISLQEITISGDHYLLSVVRDISDRKASLLELKEKEEQLQQAQKMDAIGQLAGGIAHDFNNMLGGILGAAELMQMDPKDTELVVEYSRLIIDTSTHASDLTEKLLAFSRKAKVFSTPVDCHKIINDTIEILKRSIDRRIVLQKDLRAKNFSIIGDPGQIQNIVLNLGINARDAMAGGGILTIFTENILLSDEQCESSAFDLLPGEYISIVVSDTGMGIQKSIIDKIFEPFFTTKSIGAGTGLGLAAAYGTITEHKGAIEVDSQEGRGSTFTIQLPLSKAVVEQEEASDTTITYGSGTVLLVEDESFIRATAHHILEDLGYKVIEAQDGVEAIDIYVSKKGEIDLVLLDMIMPQMNGQECFKQLKMINPDIKIVMSSGFTGNNDIALLREQGLKDFLVKPYKRHELARILHKAFS